MAKEKATTKNSNTPTTNPESKSAKKNFRQTDIPKVTLEEALKVPQAIWDQYAGNATAPIFVAEAVGVSPSSSNWRILSGASIAYGLTEGGYNSKEISLTELGRKIVSPTEENEDILAIFQAAQLPQFCKRFYDKYGNGNKLPQANIAANLLSSWGVPKEESGNTFDLIKKNGEFSGIIVTIQGNQYVNTTPSKVSATSDKSCASPQFDDEVTDSVPEALLENMNITKPAAVEPVENSTLNNKVFISHGKNRQIVEQLKQLLEFGAFEPIVSVERESTAISVPDKVFNDMRLCSSGIIHIEGERKLLDASGQEYSLINENVLIEIGAAIALFKNRVILLCKKGIQLPSNLQGLYRCEYEGEQLDYQATMKLLKTFSEFRKN